MAWQSPGGASGWNDNRFAYDGNVGTRAYWIDEYAGKWSSAAITLYLYVEGVLCSKVRIYRGNINYCRKFRLWVYTTDWEYVGESGELSADWNEMPISPPKVISKAKVEVYNTSETRKNLYEFQFNVEEPYKVTGAGGTLKSGEAAIAWEGGADEPYEVTGAGGTIKSGQAIIGTDDSVSAIQTRMLIDLMASRDCVALYRFEKGFLTHDSIGKNTLTAYNDPVADTVNFKEGESAIDFEESSNQWLAISNADLSDNFLGKGSRSGTILFWMRPESAKFSILCKKFNISYQRSFAIFTNKDEPLNTVKLLFLLYRKATNDYYAFDSNLICDAAHWYHIALTLEEVNGKTNYRLRVYDDTAGALLDDDKTGTWDYILNLGTSDFMIGGRGEASSMYDGIIDDFAVYDRALSVDEIDFIRNNNNLHFLTRRLAQEDREFPLSDPLFYEGLIINSGDLETSLSNMYYGARTLSAFNFSLSNVNGEITALMKELDLRGLPLTLKKVDIVSDEILEQHRFTIADIKLNLTTADITAMPEDLDALKMLLPKRKITTDIFPDAISEYLGMPINVCFGMATDVPLYCINEDHDKDYYDYLIGYGVIDNVICAYRLGNQIIDSYGNREYTRTLIDPAEYTFYDGSQQEPYAGYAFLRFVVEQRDPNGNYYQITANVSGVKINGVQEERGVAILKETLINETWGLGLVVNDKSFDDALDLLGDDYSFGGGFFDFKQASEWIDMMLLGCKLAQLSKGMHGYEIYIPRYYDTLGACFDEHEITLEEYYVRPTSEYVKEIVLNYLHSNLYNSYTKEVRVKTGETYGEIKEYYSPFTINEADAEIIARLLSNRFIYQDKTIRFSTGKKGIRRAIHDVITINYDALGISNQRYEIINIVRRANDYEITAAEYSENIFNLD